MSHNAQDELNEVLAFLSFPHDKTHCPERESSLPYPFLDRAEK